MNYRLIALLAVLALSSCNTPAQGCGCEHEGQCALWQDRLSFCKCPPSFTDKFCNIQTQELTEKSFTAEVSNHYSYYHIAFNNTILYLLQMYFCPLDYQETYNFEIYIEFEQQDGSLNHNFSDKKIIKFEAGNNQCMAFRTLLSTPDKKYDATSPRLVIRLRRRDEDDAAKTTQQELVLANSTNQVQISKISIIIYKFEIYQMESLQIGQFFAISLFSALLVLLFSYFLCRRNLMRRYRRFPHPAILIQDIAHFDTLMPTVFQHNQPQQAVPEQAKQCMICLLDVDGTYTRTTPCRHLFHQQCIDEWGRKSLTCPACRSSLAQPGQDTIADLQ